MRNAWIAKLFWRGFTILAAELPTVFNTYVEISHEKRPRKAPRYCIDWLSSALHKCRCGAEPGRNVARLNCGEVKYLEEAN